MEDDPNAARIEQVESELDAAKMELQRTQRELAAYKRRDAAAARLGQSAGKFAFRVILGRPLVHSLERVFQRIDEGVWPNPVERAEVVAAIFRRAVRVGLVGVALTMLPHVGTFYIAYRQTLIMERQEEMTFQVSVVEPYVEERARLTSLISRLDFVAKRLDAASRTAEELRDGGRDDIVWDLRDELVLASQTMRGTQRPEAPGIAAMFEDVVVLVSGLNDLVTDDDTELTLRGIDFKFYIDPVRQQLKSFRTECEQELKRVEDKLRMARPESGREPPRR